MANSVNLQFSSCLDKVSRMALARNPLASTTVGNISDFYTVRGGTILIPNSKNVNLNGIVPSDADSPQWVCLLRTMGLSKARSCITSMYSQYFSERSWGWEDLSEEEAKTFGSSGLVIGIECRPRKFGVGTVIIL